MYSGLSAIGTGKWQLPCASSPVSSSCVLIHIQQTASSSVHYPVLAFIRGSKAGGAAPKGGPCRPCRLRCARRSPVSQTRRACAAVGGDKTRTAAAAAAQAQRRKEQRCWHGCSRWLGAGAKTAIPADVPSRLVLPVTFTQRRPDDRTAGGRTKRVLEKKRGRERMTRGNVEALLSRLGWKNKGTNGGLAPPQ